MLVRVLMNLQKPMSKLSVFNTHIYAHMCTHIHTHPFSQRDRLQWGTALGCLDLYLCIFCRVKARARTPFSFSNWTKQDALRGPGCFKGQQGPDWMRQEPGSLNASQRKTLPWKQFLERWASFEQERESSPSWIKAKVVGHRRDPIQVPGYLVI